MKVDSDSARMLAEAKRKLEQLEAQWGDSTRSLGRMSLIDPDDFSMASLMAVVNDMRDLQPKIVHAEKAVTELRAQIL